MLLNPVLRERMQMLFDLYKAKYPNAPQPKISQTVRSRSDQNKDYAKGRSAPGPIVSNAKSGESLHNYKPALAFDVFFTVDGKYSDDPQLYKALGELAPSVGLEWGGTWKHPDMPHFQPPNYTWEDAAKDVEPTFGPIVAPQQPAIAETLPEAEEPEQEEES